MIAKHNIKINGKWYKTGEEISPSAPKETKTISKETEKAETTPTFDTAQFTRDYFTKPVEKTVAEENAVNGTDEQPTVTADTSSITKTQIIFMAKDDIQKLAYDLGVKDAYSMTRTALKYLLIEKLGL